MEERGSSMTDGTPLVNIRKTLARMKQEVVTMDVRIGVVQHTLVQAKLKDKSLMQRDAYNWNSSGNGNQENYFQYYGDKYFLLVLSSISFHFIFAFAVFKSHVPLLESVLLFHVLHPIIPGQIIYIKSPIKT